MCDTLSPDHEAVVREVAEYLERPTLEKLMATDKALAARLRSILPKPRFEVREFIKMGTRDVRYYNIFDTCSSKHKATDIPTRDQAERIAAIYNEEVE